MKLKLTPYYLIITLCLISANNLFSQKINGPREECLKNISTFSYTPPSGQTLSSASWNFGDGSTSANLSPQYVYKSKGSYVVSVTATFASGQSRTDTFAINVHNLPKAIFNFDKLSDFCISNNNICILDSSLKAENSQNITNTLIVWGDGNFINNQNPAYGQSSCHKYQLADNYNIKIEVTDIYGCKSSQSKTISIKEQTNASIGLTNIFKDCYTKRVCVKNQSYGKLRNAASYLWTFSGSSNDTNRYFNTQKCFEYTQNFNGTVKLKVTDANGCTDEETAIYSVVIDSIPNSIKLDDSIYCYGNRASTFARLKVPAADYSQWLIDGNSATSDLPNELNINPRLRGLTPGLHKITMRITRGNCTRNINAWFRVIGPVASFKVFDDDRCFLLKQRPIDLISDNEYTNRARTKYAWTIGDPYGDKCSTYRKKNKDTGIYCNYSNDYFVRHFFRSPYGSFNIKLIVKDTVNGCSDSSAIILNLDHCHPYLYLDSLTFCQGEVIEFPDAVNDPVKISLDSGKTFHNLPYKPPAKLTGTFDAWLTFKTVKYKYSNFIRNDSMIVVYDSITYYDTLIKKKYIVIYPLNTDSIYFKFSADCSNKKGVLTFANPLFKAGQSIKVVWGDNSIYYNKFNKDTLLDSLTHIYPRGSISANLIVEIANSHDCSYSKSFTLKYGYVVNFNNIEPYFCDPVTLCPSIRVYDLVRGKVLTDAELAGKVKWYLNDSFLRNHGSTLCLDITKPGDNKIKIVFDGPETCDDTGYYNTFIQDLRAGIESTSRTVFCNELKRFMDSSTFLYYPNEKLKSFNWDFGSGKFTNPVKDPLKSLNTSSPTIKVRHTVSTEKGCTDTIEYDLKVIGSHPYFTIEDTIACESLEAIFHNLSENCKGYIWEFGDPDGSILPLPDKRDVIFNYKKPGRYTIKLNGYDSFYNPATNAIYFCNAVFPDPDYQKDSIRAVVVLPMISTRIHGPDTLCPYTIANFTTDTLPAHDINQWAAPGTAKDKPTKDTFSYIVGGPGKYKVQCIPVFLDTIYNGCADTTYKEVVVLDVKADFTYNDTLSKFIVYFTNKSEPIESAYNWDFGDPASGSKNQSEERHPQHNYGYDSGTYKVCLIATNIIGCKDTSCKKIRKTGIAALTLPNVFTPSNTDGMNDRYDVHIVGETFYHLLVYDRWGVLVFEGDEDDVSNGNGNWNGKLFNTGAECPSGTYYYLFYYKMGDDPKKHVIEGTITLIR